MMEKKKAIYEKPEALIVRLTLYTPIAQHRPPGGGGGIGEWDEYNPTTNGGTQHGRETGGSFFDDEELDDGFLNGGPNMFTDWEEKDRL